MTTPEPASEVEELRQRVADLEVGVENALQMVGNLALELGTISDPPTPEELANLRALRARMLETMERGLRKAASEPDDDGSLSSI